MKMSLQKPHRALRTGRPNLPPKRNVGKALITPLLKVNTEDWFKISHRMNEEHDQNPIVSNFTPLCILHKN